MMRALFFIFLLIPIIIYAQETELKKNYIAIHANLTPFSFHGNTEVLWTKEKFLVGARLGAGSWASWKEDNRLSFPQSYGSVDDAYWGHLLLLSLVWMSHPTSRHHFEGNLGTQLMIDQTYNSKEFLYLGVTTKFYPIINAGYRYQDLSQKGLFLRAGVGTEYAIGYVGLGYSF